MTAATITTTTRPQGPTSGEGNASAGTLAGEHAVLMRDVARRVAPVLALLDIHAWPHAELGTLTGLLRAAVLRQASDEEVLLYPHDATAAPFAELSADHVRLHMLTARLEHAIAEPCPAQELRVLTEDLLSTLQQHLRDEQAILAALPHAPIEIPSAAALAAGGHSWLPTDDEPVQVVLDRLPGDQAHELCVERLLRLQPGQSAEIHSEDADKLDHVCRWVQAFDSVGYGVARRSSGREHTLEVTRRVAG